MIVQRRLVKLHRTLFRSFHCIDHLRLKKSQTKSKLFTSKPFPSKPNLKETVRAIDSTKSVDPETYIHLLQACIHSRSITEGKRIHQHILKNNTHITISPPLLEKLTLMYIACGETELARVIFDEIRRPNVFLWNAMIRSYSWNGPADRAIELYHRMRECGVRPDKFTFPFVLKACSGLSAIGEGKAIHDHARSVGLDSDVYVSTALVDMYAKCGCLADCYDVFDKMPERDVVAWNAMIAGFSLSGLYEEMFDLVVGMQREGKALNSSTVVALLPAVGQRKGLHRGKSIHGYSLRRGFSEGCVLLGTALLDMYGKCECLDYARRVFDLLDVKNEVTWSAMIGAFVFCNRMEEAIELFDRMVFVENLNPTPTILGSVLRACSSLSNICRGKRIHGFSIKFGFDFNMVVGNSLISLYSKGGHIDEAMNFFNGMASRDTISYSAIISGCVQNGDAEEALSLFRKMQSYDVEPDLATMVNIIPACSQLAALQHGRSSHCYVIIRGFAFETPIANALIDMYSKCGKVNLAREVFDRKEDKDIVSWNAMISGYGIHGHGLEAISMFLDLRKTDDVRVTKISPPVFYVISIIKRLDPCFRGMHNNQNILIEQLICMIVPSVIFLKEMK
ncbi:Pentatricopeptide repeat-containing protein [Acorus calamus]|uniref:Pentatricopeptide repeat-containing protein n=1 Tax=Acorus calamus TaxID=4465 RepID=A0AAV9D365_ACOCL|nr:Pentatricopeptide repeat-containing protein [Acorus calamus]